MPLLVIPTNRQSETVDLADGLRARLRPGQRSVEIERRADNGLFGTGIGARWETLPVDAELSAQDDGSARVLIDQEQLERAVGPEAGGRAWDATGSAMARPPKKRSDDARSPANTANKPNQTPNPGGGSGPPGGPNVTTAAELAARILEQTNRPRSQAEAQAQIVEAYQQVRRDRGDQTPDRQYRGEHGFETAVGVRMPSALPDPTPGREFSPDDPNHRKGYIGELELAISSTPNKVTSLCPMETRQACRVPTFYQLDRTGSLPFGIPRRVARNGRWVLVWRRLLLSIWRKSRSMCCERSHLVACLPISAIGR